MKKLLPVAALLIPAVLVCSCEHRRYDIVMSSKDGVLERTLMATSVGDKGGGRLPEAELAALAKLYAKHEPNTAGGDEFAGTFAGRTPDDIGGAGFHSYVVTPLGSATIYSEQFRGNDDLVLQIEKRERAADRLVDLVSGWLKTRVGGEKDFDKLAAFLDTVVRRDMKNVSLYAWTVTNDLVRVERTPSASRPAAEASSQPAGETASGAAASTPPSATQAAAEAPTPSPRPGPEELVQKGQEETAIRVMQYLAERGYLETGDIPSVIASVSGGEGIERLLSSFAGRALERKAGVANTALIGKVTALWTAEANATVASLRTYLADTSEYKTRLAAWKADPNHADPNSQPPDSLDVLTDCAGDWIGIELSPESDELHVRFRSLEEPVFTNGTWDANAKAVSWDRAIRQAGAPPRRMPTVCYAAWASPNEAAQRKHFGGVILREGDLFRYCGWYQTLDDAHRNDWDAMVAGLAPGPKLWTTLGEFRAKDAAFAPGCGILENAIKRSPASTQPAGGANVIYKPLFSTAPATRPETRSAGR